MIDFKTILLTTDFSAYSETAFLYAGELARRFGGIIRLLYVFDEGPAITGYPDVYVPLDWIEATRKERLARLELLARKITLDEKVDVQPCMREGRARDGILDEAKECHADCIVMATHGRTGIPHFIFGSVAEHVLRQSPCPVMTLHPALARVKEPVKEEQHAEPVAS
jgi:nucleotide-binding universal stress UspA family protein